MLTIKKAFHNLITLLNTINPKFPLPVGVEAYLFNHMEEYSPKANEVLVRQGNKATHAYYIIRGHIYVYYFDEHQEKHVKRFYRENRIVAFLSFLEQTKSPYTIVAARNTLLSKICNDQLQDIYKTWASMKEFAMLVLMRNDEEKERLRNEMLNKRGHSKVLEFYRTFPGLLHSKSISDDVVACYLMMKRAQLSVVRADLLRRGLLPKK